MARDDSNAKRQIVLTYLQPERVASSLAFQVASRFAMCAVAAGAVSLTCLFVTLRRNPLEDGNIFIVASGLSLGTGFFGTFISCVARLRESGSGPWLRRSNFTIMVCGFAYGLLPIGLLLLAFWDEELALYGILISMIVYPMVSGIGLIRRP